MVAVVSAAALAPAPAGAADARTRSMLRGDACQQSARRYETRCLMPRIEARLRFADDGDPRAFVARMRDIDQACVEVTATGLAGCTAWPRVAPTAEYRRWLRDVQATWERRQQAVDGARPECPPGVRHCL